MGMPHIRMGLLGLALALGVALVLLWFRPRLFPEFVRPGPTVAERSRAETKASRKPGDAPNGVAPERSRLADDLNLATGDIHRDLRALNEIFIAYRTALRTGNPVGENGEITAALVGRNKLGYAFVPADSPAINARGELCDRWGSPFFFHQLSGERMEIRSAGPDRKLWTGDDEVLTP